MQYAAPPFALEIHGLVKRFDRPAVDGLDLNVRAGEFYALLGPNGAGKTTTLRMIAGLLRPDAGSIRVAGIDALADSIAAKRLMAWISDEPMIYDKLTPREYLEFVAGLWGLARALHEPQLIMLDEPLTGLDAGSARQVKGVLRERVPAGGTVIMTTHILEVAERMADRIGVIAHGRLLAEGTLAELRRLAAGADVNEGAADLASLEDTFLALVADAALPAEAA